MSAEQSNLNEKPRGACPDCWCPESKVIWTRKRPLPRKGEPTLIIFRRRECDHCGRRYTTKEEIVG